MESSSSEYNDETDYSEGDEADYSPKKKKALTKRRKNVAKTSTPKIQQKSKASSQTSSSRRVTRSMNVNSSRPSSLPAQISADDTDDTIDPAPDVSAVPLPKEISYRGSKRMLIFSHLKKGSKEEMWNNPNAPNTPPMTEATHLATLKHGYRRHHPNETYTDEDLSPASDIEEEVVVDGQTIKIRYTGMGEVIKEGRIRHMYVTAGSKNMKPQTKKGLINNIRSMHLNNERIKRRQPQMDPDPDDIKIIAVNGSKYELWLQERGIVEEKDLYQYKRSKQLMTEKGWKKKLAELQKREKEKYKRIQEWLTHQTRPIPKEVRGYITPFKINPMKIHQNVEETEQDQESVDEMMELFKKLDILGDGKIARKTKYLYQVVVIPTTLVSHIHPDLTGHCPEIYDFLRDNENNPGIRIQLYCGRNSTKPDPSNYHFDSRAKSSIRREVEKGGRAFLLHVDEKVYSTRWEARLMIVELEAAVLAYLAWITPYTDKSNSNSQEGKLKYCRANPRGEFDGFLGIRDPLFQKHVIQLSMNASVRPFHFLDDPSTTCTINHNKSGYPYSAMLHPDRNKIFELDLDKFDDKASIKEEEDSSEADLSFDGDDILDDDSDTDFEEEVDDPKIDGNNSEREFLKSLFFEHQPSLNTCGLHAVNNFLQQPMFTAEIFKLFVDELVSADNVLRDTDEQIQTQEYGGVSGDYNIVVLERALATTTQFEITRDAREFNLESSLGFIYNPGYHWVAVRNFEGRWVSFDSMADGPVPLTQEEVLDLVEEFGGQMLIITSSD